MREILAKFCIAFVVIFAIDQAIKWAYVAGWGRYEGEYFSLILAYNKGVAFSMFAFWGENLKFIQLALISGVFGYLLYQCAQSFRQSGGKGAILGDHTTALGILFGAGSSNLLDRFIHGGVVDYVFWHKWFEFAVFNFADVMIDVAVAVILIQSFRKKH